MLSRIRLSIRRHIKPSVDTLIGTYVIVYQKLMKNLGMGKILALSLNGLKWQYARSGKYTLLQIFLIPQCF